MKPEQAKRFGKYLRRHREAKGLTTRQLGDLADVASSTIVRIERGELLAPAPDKLSRIAEALDLRLADVYAMAQYTVASELPTLRPYLRTKYRQLPAEAGAQLEAYAEKLVKRHGVDLKGPAPGEDEGPELVTTKSSRKGGTRHDTSKRNKR